VPVVLTALGLWAIVDVIAIGALANQARVFDRVRHGSVSLALRDAARHGDALVGRVLVAVVAVHVVTAAAWLCWFHRVHHETTLLRRPRFLGWAVGAWLVPVVSLWRPTQLVDGAWAAGDPDQDVQAKPPGVSPRQGPQVRGVARLPAQSSRGGERCQYMYYRPPEGVLSRRYHRQKNRGTVGQV
jgi:fermentation-respiration switch protein FrsA (DUF1100 family)